MFSLLDNAAAGFSLEMEIHIYQDENLYVYLHPLAKIEKEKIYYCTYEAGPSEPGGVRGNHLPRFGQD